MTELIKRIMSNPKTTVLGGVILAVYGAGNTLAENAIQPWGDIVKGLAGVLVLIGFALAHDKPKGGDSSPPEDK
jgi:hypothetical protein